jgi:hypothetical protein
MKRLYHEHEWSLKYSYWAVRMSTTTTIYYQDKTENDDPVWIQECLICHLVKEEPREIDNEHISSGS